MPSFQMFLSSFSHLSPTATQFLNYVVSCSKKLAYINAALAFLFAIKQGSESCNVNILCCFKKCLFYSFQLTLRIRFHYLSSVSTQNKSTTSSNLNKHNKVLFSSEFNSRSNPLILLYNNFATFVLSNR